MTPIVPINNASRYDLDLDLKGNLLGGSMLWMSSLFELAPTYLITPVEQLPDVAKHAVLDDDEGGRHLVVKSDGKPKSLKFCFHLKGVNVGVMVMTKQRALGLFVLRQNDKMKSLKFCFVFPQV